MGNHQRQPQQHPLAITYKQHDWNFQNRSENLQVWRNKYSKEAVEVYQNQQMPTEIDMNRYQIRSYDNDLVRVYHLALQSPQELCSAHPSVQILIERIPLRLYNISQLTRQQALTILVSCFRAFSFIQQHFQIVLPSQALIGFNEKGRTKIWLNKYWYNNRVDKTCMQRQYNQGRTVGQRIKIIFEIIEQRSQYSLLPAFIKKHIYHPDITYPEILTVIQNFAYQERLSLKKYINMKTITDASSPPDFQQSLYRSHIRNRSLVVDHQINYKALNQSFVQEYQGPIFTRQQSSLQGKSYLKRVYSMHSIDKELKGANGVENTYQKRQSMAQNDKSNVILSSRTQVASTLSNYSKIMPPKIHFITNHRQNSSFVKPSLENTIKRQRIFTQYPTGTNCKPPGHSEYQNYFQITSRCSQVQKDDENRYLSKPLQLRYVQASKNTQICEQRSKIQSQQFKKRDQKVNEQMRRNVDYQDQSSEQVLQSVAFNSEQSDNKILYNPEWKIKFTSQTQNHQFISFAPTKEFIEAEEGIKNSSESLSQSDLDEQRRISLQNKQNFQLSLVENSIPNRLLQMCEPVQSNMHFLTKRSDSIYHEQTNIRQSISDVKRMQSMEYSEIEQYIRQKYRIKEKHYHYHYYEQKDPYFQSNTKKYKPSFVQRNNQRKSQQTPYPYSTKSQYYQQHYEENNPLHSLNRIQDHESGQQDVVDFLDVNFLQKRLSKRFTENTAQKKEQQQEDNLNIAKLEEGLMKFSMSQFKESTKIQLIPDNIISSLQTSQKMINLKLSKKVSAEDSLKDYKIFKNVPKNTHKANPKKKIENQRSSVQEKPYRQVIFKGFQQQKSSLKALQKNNQVFDEPKVKQFKEKEVVSYFKAEGAENKGFGVKGEVGLRKKSSVQSSKGRKISYDDLRQYLWN